jgi:hypothetical protein
MHVTIDSHTRLDQGQIPPPEDSPRTVGYEYAGCRSMPRLKILPPSRSERPQCIQLMETPKLPRSSSINRNISMQVDLPIDQAPECESIPRGVPLRNTLFSINFLDASEHWSPPPCGVNGNYPLPHEFSHPARASWQICFNDSKPYPFHRQTPPSS